jgi:predicted ester cyclase
MVFTATCKAFPDANFTIKELLLEDDKVINRWEATRTHKGDFIGISTTNNKGTWSGTTIYWIADGKVIEWRNQSSLLSMIQHFRQP